MIGYAAASYQRGVHFIQIPPRSWRWSILQGAKTGVNHPAGKNMIGAFYQPQCVLIDIDTANALRLRICIWYEVVKICLHGAEFFEWQLNVGALMAREETAVVHAIKRSCVNKAEVACP